MSGTITLAEANEKIVRDLNVAGHKFIIRYKCSECRRIKGRVIKDGKEDKEDVFYQRSFIKFKAGDSLPTSLCPVCQKNDPKMPN